MRNKNLIVAIATAGVLLVLMLSWWWTSRRAASRSRDEVAERTNTQDANGRHASAQAETRPAHQKPTGDDPTTQPNPPHRPLPAVAIDDDSRFGALEGRVINWSTRFGVAGAELGFVHDGETHEVIAGPDGAFRFVAPAAGRFTLATVTADDFLPYAPELGGGSVSFVARPGRAIQHADVFLFPAIDYVGTVVDAEGAPVAGAEIELFGAESGERALVGIESRFRSDAAGQFVFHAPDDALLEARHPDHAPGRAIVDGPVQISHALTITLGTAPASSDRAITGSIVDGEGIGLADIEIHAEAVESGLFRPAHAMSEADGSFMLVGLDATRYVVTARMRGRPTPTSAPVEPGDAVQLVVDDGFALHGRLVDHEGAPIVAGSVVLSRVDGPVRRTPIAGLSIFDAGGEFEFAGLTPGSVQLEAIAQGHARSEPVTVEIPHLGEPIELRLDAGATVFGTVRDAKTGDALELALITVVGVSSRDSLLPALSSTVTGPGGSFELAGIDPGRTSIQVVAFAHDGKILSGIELAPGERHGPLDVALEAVAAGERPKTELAGIGVAIEPLDDGLRITQVIEGGGAEAAGLVVGDRIISVDGETVVALGFDDAIQNIRGQAGTTVELELRRGAGEVIDINVERRVIAQ